MAIQHIQSKQGYTKPARKESARNKHVLTAIFHELEARLQHGIYTEITVTVKIEDGTLQEAVRIDDKRLIYVK